MKIMISTILAALIASQSVAPAFANRFSRPAENAILQEVALDCHAIGQKKADQLGGQLAKAGPVIKNGKEACLVVVLIPAKNGNRPRRAEFVISN